MTEATKNFLIRVAGIVVGLLVIIIVGRFVGAVSRGTAHVPEEVQSQIWTAITGVIVVLSTATVLYVNSWSNARAIERAAQQTQLNSDRNAQATQQKITEVAHTTDEVKHVVTNGLSKDTAAMVKADAEKAARAAADAVRGSRRQQDQDQTAQAIAALTGKLDALFLSLTPPTVAPAETAEDSKP